MESFSVWKICMENVLILNVPRAKKLPENAFVNDLTTLYSAVKVHWSLY